MELKFFQTDKVEKAPSKKKKAKASDYPPSPPGLGPSFSRQVSGAGERAPTGPSFSRQVSTASQGPGVGPSFSRQVSTASASGAARGEDLL